ncbi:MAG TPA: lipopolysaccharide heptosyltransferase II [Syntrophobacteraceae bacterium]|nr:lipopolysaccharide heptosyltransferase II [Syntrophobacteraceae bacterium]HBZ56242.1 lipopolysaccharide heptosyltransferase II [Syntrophobacteraceae bacterium]
MGAPETLSRDCRKILIRSPNWIGDAVMATPAMSALRSTFPGATLVVAAHPQVAELFRPHPYCDAVVDYDRRGRHRGPGGVFRFAWELRRERFDLAILLQNAVEAAILAFLAGIPRRAGYCTDLRGPLLTHGVPVGERERRLHHTEYYCNMLAMLGISGGDAQLRLSCTAEEQDWARRTLGPGRWIAIHPGAAYGSAKRWFPDRFAAVADHLAAHHDARIVLVGGSDAVAAARDMELAMTHRPLSLAGRTSIRQFMAILEPCRLLITNDSGPMHVGAALGVPVVAIFGPTDHTTTSPLAVHHRLVRKPTDCAPCLKRHCPTDHRCMLAITADDVIQAAAELLENGS